MGDGAERSEKGSGGWTRGSDLGSGESGLTDAVAGGGAEGVRVKVGVHVATTHNGPDFGTMADSCFKKVKGVRGTDELAVVGSNIIARLVLRERESVLK
jgi:hypothetical protein